MIRQEHGRWVLRTRDGSRILGRHDTRDQAEAQERAVWASKGRLGNPEYDPDEAPTCPDCEVLIDGLWRTGVCDECKHILRKGEVDPGCENCLGTGRPVCCKCEGTGVDPEGKDRRANPDEDLRALERRWKKSGDEADRKQWLAAAARAGQKHAQEERASRIAEHGRKPSAFDKFVSWDAIYAAPQQIGRSRGQRAETIDESCERWAEDAVRY